MIEVKDKKVIFKFYTETFSASIYDVIKLSSIFKKFINENGYKQEEIPNGIRIETKDELNIPVLLIFDNYWGDYFVYIIRSKEPMHRFEDIKYKAESKLKNKNFDIRKIDLPAAYFTKSIQNLLNSTSFLNDSGSKEKCGERSFDYLNRAHHFESDDVYIFNNNGIFYCFSKAELKWIYENRFNKEALARVLFSTDKRGYEFFEKEDYDKIFDIISS
jgi:hypothetical protein